MSNSYIFFLNNLKISLARKSYFFDITLPKQNLPLLNLLKSLNVIRRFKCLQGSVYRVYPFFYKRYNFLHHINIYASKTSTITLNRQSLRLLKLTTEPNSIIIDTPKGLLTLNEALYKNVGGRLICTIS